MKNINYIKKALFIFAFALAIISCDRDDNVGNSVTVVTSPNTTITLNFIEPVTIIENDQEFTFTVTLSTTQVVDIKLYVQQIAGTATADDYEVTSLITIPTGSTTATGTIKILHDDLIEGTETLTLQIGDQRTANTSMTPATASFNILNVTEGDLVIDLAWSMPDPTTDDSGNEIDPTDFADLRLLIMDVDGNIIDEADGSSFETFVFNGNMPDGEYLVSTDFYAANEDIVRDLDLSLVFNQIGTINQLGSTYERAINNLGTCDLNFYVMTKIIKTGTSYTFEDISTHNYDLAPYVPFGGTDATDVSVGAHVSEIVIKNICDGFFIKGLNASWMLNSWGEEIQQDTAADVFAQVAADGTVTIDSQYIFTTLYDGDLYDYTISASGTYDAVAGVLHLEYNLDQDGFSPNGWMFDNGYMSTELFVADVNM